MQLTELLLDENDVKVIVTNDCTKGVPHLLWGVLDHYVPPEYYERIVEEYSEKIGRNPRLPKAADWYALSASEENMNRYVIVCTKDDAIPLRVLIENGNMILAPPLDWYSYDIFYLWRNRIDDALMHTLGIKEHLEGWLVNQIITIDPPSWKSRLNRSWKHVVDYQIHEDVNQILYEWQSLRYANAMQRYSRFGDPGVMHTHIYAIAGYGVKVYGTKVTHKDGSVGYGVWSVSGTELFHEFVNRTPEKLSGAGLGSSVILSGIELAKKLGINTIDMGYGPTSSFEWKKQWSGGNCKHTPELVLQKDPYAYLYKFLRNYHVPSYTDTGFDLC